MKRVSLALDGNNRRQRVRSFDSKQVFTSITIKKQFSTQPVNIVLQLWMIAIGA